MATKVEMLIEADRRGLLSGDKKAAFDEAVRRGAITLPASSMDAGQLESVEFAEPVSGLDAARLQSTVVYPEEETMLGSFLAGGRRGMENLGQGLAQRGAEIGEALGYDTQEFQDKLEVSGDISKQKFKPTKEDSPVSATAGEIAGTIAAFPYAPARIPQAVAAGATFGALQPTDDSGDIAMNVVQDAALGGLGAWAAPFIQRGFNKSQAMFSGLYKKATGADPRPEMFTPDGNLSDQGLSALDKLGISEEEFARLYRTLDQNLDPVQAARVARAQEQGIPLTTAQATKDFAQQEAEQTLKSGIGRESEAARQIADKQQEAMRGAQEGFELGFGEVADREARGQTVQDTLRSMQKEGRQNVSELYKQAADVTGEALPLDKDLLLDSIDEQMMRPVDDKVVSSLESLMAKFGLVDGEVVQSGRFRQVVDADGNKIKFRGEQTPLTLDNAEAFRKGLNEIRGADQSGAVGQVINALDSHVDEIVSGMPAGSARTEAFQAARQAAREQKEIFSQKDIIQNVTGYKKNTLTDIVQPDRVIDSIAKGANAKGNLQRVKSVLLKDPTNKTLDAWKSIQAQGVADIFGQSINPATGDISGQRLKSAIKKFGGGSEKEGVNRLKVLLGDRYKEFNNIVESIGDATIPVKGTTNTSGTAYKLMNLMARVGSVGTFGADAVIPLINKTKDAARSRRVLRQIEAASPEEIKQAVKANDEMIDAYIRLGLTGTLREQ